MDIDFDALRSLLEMLREHSVTEFVQGELRVVLGVRPTQEIAAVGNGTSLPAQPKRAYEALFRGRPPTFEQFRDTGVPMPEAE